MSSRTVLTAGHCSLDITVDDAFIVLGDLNIPEDEDREQKVDLTEAEWINHPRYDSRKNKMFFYDFAIILLARPVKFTKYVIPICLPDTSTMEYEYIPVIASGWGTLSYMSGQPDVLQKVTLYT